MPIDTERRSSWDLAALCMLPIWSSGSRREASERVFWVCVCACMCVQMRVLYRLPSHIGTDRGLPQLRAVATRPHRHWRLGSCFGYPGSFGKVLRMSLDSDGKKGGRCAPREVRWRAHAPRCPYPVSPVPSAPSPVVGVRPGFAGPAFCEAPGQSRPRWLGAAQLHAGSPSWGEAFEYPAWLSVVSQHDRNGLGDKNFDPVHGGAFGR